MFNQRDIEVDSDELQQLTTDIHAIKDSELPELKTLVSSLSAELHGITSQPTNTQAREKLARYAYVYSFQ